MTPNARTIDKYNTFNRQVNPSKLACRGSSPDCHKRSCRYTTLTYRDVVDLDKLACLRSAWVDLLNRYNWDWFTTLTFRDLPKSFTAVNRVKKWLTAIQKDEKRAIGYFMATEWFKTQKCAHFHLLMGNLEGVRRDKWWQVWFTWYGRNRILPYDKERGAGYYLTKYVIKEENDSALFTIKGLEYVNQLYLKGVN